MICEDQLLNDWQLDRIVRKHTAFNSIESMRKSMREHGYVPTLRSDRPSWFEGTDVEWIDSNYRHDLKNLRDHLQSECKLDVYPESNWWTYDAYKENGIEYSFKLSDMKMSDLYECIRRRKRNVVRREIHKDYRRLAFTGSGCTILALGKEGRLKLDDPCYIDGLPTRKLLKEMAEDNKYQGCTHLCVEANVMVKADWEGITLAERWEYAESTDSYWWVNILVD